MVEAGVEECSQRTVDLPIIHRLGHAVHPNIACILIDRKSRVPLSQTRMSEPLNIVLRAAEPAAEKPKQLVS